MQATHARIEGYILVFPGSTFVSVANRVFWKSVLTIELRERAIRIYLGGVV